MKKVFLAFGSNFDGRRNHINNAHNLTENVKKLEIFDEYKLYGEQDLINDKPFWNQHKNFILNNKRGYGYWLWKPYLIKKTMENLNDGDILLYLDSQCEIVLDEKKDLLNYLDIVKEKKILYYYEHIEGLPEINLSKMDLIHRLDMQNNELIYSDQYGATVQLIYVCNETREFYNIFYNYGIDYYNIDDSPSILKNIDNFFEHRHDQSIFSLLIKKYNLFSDIIINKCIYTREVYKRLFLI